jgi:hypothetical protein
VLVTTLKPIENFDRLKLEVLELIKELGQGLTQIMCQGPDPENHDWNTGSGRISILNIKEESDYCYLNPRLKGTELEKLINEYQGFRTRIITLTGRKCYSVHADPGLRVHIPIVTSDQSWMVWPYDNYSSRLETGHSYLTDTTKNHTFLNGSLADRIHIVMCVNLTLQDQLDGV